MAGIINTILTRFSSQGAGDVESDANRVGRSQTRLGQSSASAGREFSAQASGLGGLVAAYAGAAATIFAVTAAFDALSRAAQSTQTLAGLQNLATASGESADALLASVREITKGQLSLTESAQQINLSLSAGFNTEQIEGLADVALRASRALGRDLTDAYTRVVRGSAKLETELLDELGIYTKIDPAIRAYATATGKVASELTEFERRQAFVNSVIAEGERKFNSINVTVPTSAEKIAAFGVRIQDLLQSMGRLLADGIAPVAEFLTDNFAGSLAAVGALLILVARTAVVQLTVALTALQAKLLAVAQTSSAFVVKSLGDFKGRGAAAQTAIKGLTLTMNGLTRANQAELKSLRDVAQTRKLTNEELRRSGAILTERKAKLTTNIRTLFEERRAQRAIATSTTATTAERAAATAALDRLNSRLTTNIGLLSATRAQLASTTLALRTFSAAISFAVAGVIRFSAAIVTGLLATTTRLIGLAGGLIGFIAIFGLIGTAVASAIGKQDEYNALLEQGALKLKTFFAPSTFTSFKDEFTNLASSAVDEIDTVAAGLGDIEKFTIKTKSFGIDVDLVKTKEDLVKEVGSVLNEVATSSAVTFGEAFTGEVGRRGAVIGGILGGIVGSFFAPVLGTAIGAATGSAIGASIAAALGSGSEVETISLDNATRLGQLIGDSTIAGISQQAGNENLAKALNLLYEQGAAAAELSLEGRRYLRTQVELASAIIDNVGNIRQLQAAADALGLSVADLEKKFEVSATAIGDTLVKTINRGFDTVQVEIVLQNEQSTIDAIERIRELSSGPGDLSMRQGTALQEARSSANQLQITISSNQQLLDDFAADTSNATQQVIADLNNLQSGFQAFVPQISDTTPLTTLETILGRLQSTLEANTRRNIFGFRVAQAGREAEVRAIESTIANVEALITARERETTISSNVIDEQERLTAQLAEQQAIIESFSAITDREIISSDQLALIEDFLTALANLGITTSALSRDILATNNLLTDLVNTADVGALTLENLAQAESNVDRALTRSSRGLQDAVAQLEILRTQRNAIAASGIDTSGAILADIDAQVARQEELVAAESRALGSTLERKEAILAGVAPLREQLQITKDIRDNFEQEIKARQNAIGLFTNTGRVTINADEEAFRRAEFLNDTIQRGNQALNERNDLEEQYKQLLGNQPTLIAQISSLIGENAKEQRKTLLLAAGVDQTIIDTIDNLGILNAEQVALADNAELATDALQGTVIEFIRKLFEATVSAKKAIAELQFEISQLARESEIARIEFQVALDNQGFDALKTQIENEIESIENEITLMNQLTELGNFRPVSALTDQVRTELGPALEESARRFAEITGKTAQAFNLNIPTEIQGLTESEAAARETEKQFSILEKRLQLNDLELERETKRIENERGIMQLEFELFYAEQQFETQKQQALADLNRSQLQGLADIYSQALSAQTTVQQQHVDALTQVFIQAANAMAAAQGNQGFSANITAPNISGESTDVKITTSLNAAITAYNETVDEQIRTTQELSDARIQAEVEAFANRQTLLDGEQTAAETAHQANISRIIEEGNITAATGANTIREIAEEAEKAAKKIPMFTGRFEELARSFKSAFSGAFSSVVDFILTGGEEGESFGDRLKMAFGKLLTDIGTSILETAVIDPISNLLANKLTGLFINRLPVDIVGDSMAEDVGGDAAVTASNQALTGLGSSLSSIGTTVAGQLNTTATTVGNALQQLGFGVQQGSGTASAQLSGAGAQLQVAEQQLGNQVQTGAAVATPQIITSGAQQAQAQTVAGAAIGASGMTASTLIMAALQTLLPILIIFGLTKLFSKKASGGPVQMALGGAVKQFAAGGMLRDRVPALLEPGEFVIRRPAAKAIGGPALQQMNATGKTSGGAPVINIINNGTPQEARAEQPRFDGERYIIDIVTKDIQNNGPIRKTLRGA